MKNSKFSKKRESFQDEFDRYVEGQLDQAEIDELESRLSEDEEAKRWFAEYLHLHAVLQADGEELLAEGEGKLIEFPVSQRWLTGLRYAATVAFLLGCVWLLRGSIVTGEQREVSGGTPVVAEVKKNAVKAPVVEVLKDITVATLADTRECKWAGSSLPTSNGARLGPGRLHLLEGLATVVFDGGAQVTMEAPALIEVVSAEKCRLISGGLVGFVKKGAEGFQVETNDAMVTDYGTRFGVTVGKSGRSEVVVLEGAVGVEHSQVKGEKRLEMGDAVRYDAKSFLSGKAPGAIGAEPDRNAGLGNKEKGRGWKAITTALGQGKDTYVRQGNGGGPFGRSPLVMAKRSPDRKTNQRKTYLGFDLRSFNGVEIREAELALAIRSSGLGYASVVPDSTFTVYGLRDEALDQWDETSMTWENAPANVLDHGSRLDESKVVKLGSFEIKQGVSSGFREVEGELFTDFLNNDSNGIATLIIVRETEQSSGNGLVHAFASREHPTAMAPTLRVRVVE
ncbi:MAG: DNRLRE domain-containing protein [Verrucomicrobia bacterium]|nr:DNRLRE domain-containing protein [Verrucomicrobiota bacterium]